MTKDQARAQYIAWIARESPLMYARIVAMAKKNSLDRTGLAGLSGWVDTLVTAAVTVAGTLVAKKQADQAASIQKKQQAADLQLALLDVNTKRAQAGLPPVDINGKVIPSAALPTPSTLNRIEVAAGAASQTNYLPWVIGGGAVLAGLLLVTRGR